MKNLYYLIIVSLLWTKPSQAYSVNDFFNSLGSFFGFIDTSCPEQPEILPNTPVEQLYAMGIKLRKEKKTCEAARHFYELRWQHQGHELTNKSWVQEVETYLEGDELHLGINEANIFLNERSHSQEAEYMHFLIVKAIYQQMLKIGTDRTEEWINYALGINSDQSIKNPFMVNLSFRSYLTKYPDSPRSSEVQKMLQTAREFLTRKYIDIGLFYRKERAYTATINRLKTVLSFGPQVKHYAEAYYEMIYTLTLFSRDIRNGKISDSKLAVMLEKPDMNPKDIHRRELSAATLDQAKIMLLDMQKNLPQSPWTKKAMELF